ncbi:helix-turn-helix domain-containing protein [Streptomyces roseifaciens]
MSAARHATQRRATCLIRRSSSDLPQRRFTLDKARSRRARVGPREAGLGPETGGRRVPGLRREEVARLAGISVDYCVRLERGRNPNVSASVLEAVARVLRLDAAERAHLFGLAWPVPGRARPGTARRLRSGCGPGCFGSSTP